MLRNPSRQNSNLKYRLAIACLAILIPSAFCPLPCYAQGIITEQSIITTVAGIGRVFQGDGGPATSATLGGVRGIAVDPAGNIFATDVDNHLVVKIAPDRTLTVVAGNGIKGFSGDGGPATNASLHTPTGVALDAAGNIYIADSANVRVRRVGLDGTIDTVAGGGGSAGLGDGGPATNASLSGPICVAVDVVGNIYVADEANHRIRKVDSSTGIITTVAGSGATAYDPGGYAGDGGPATSALLNLPMGVAVDANGNLFISDTLNFRIRKVRPDGVITTVAGNGVEGFSGDGGAATNASLGRISGCPAVDGAGNIYIAGFNSSRIRRVSPQGIITTVAGSSQGFSGDGGPATSAKLWEPQGVAVDTSGNVYIADTRNQRIRKVNSSGIINTIAGVGAQSYGDGGPATSAALNHPQGVVVDGAGNFYISDTDNHRVRKVSAAGIIATVAGNEIPSFSGDGGQAVLASLNLPWGLALSPGGELYIADINNQRVRKVSSTGIITTIAGGGQSGVDLGDPTDVAFDSAGNLYITAITDIGQVLKVTPNGIISTIASNLVSPQSIAIDAAGNAYIADRISLRVVKVSPGGTVITVAGGGECCDPGDGGPATSAYLNGANGVALDGIGNLYISAGNVRKVDTNGIISSVTDVSGPGGFSGDGGPVRSADLAGLVHIAFDQTGNLYIVDSGNDRIRKVVVGAPSFSVSPTSLSFSASAGAAVVAVQQVSVLSAVAGLAWSAQVSTASGGDWLSVSPSAGSTPGTIAVSVDVTSLAPGTYQGTVTVQALLAAPPTQTVAVELTVGVALAPKLAVEPVSISFEIPAGAGNPPAQTLRVSNAGGGTLEWTLQAATTSGGNWLIVAPGSGTASASSPATVQVAANVGELAAGVYSGTVQVESATTGESTTVAVTLLLAQVPQTILVSQSGLLFTGVEGAGVVPSQNFGILNIGQDTMSWTVQGSTLSGGNWLSVSPANGQSEAESLEIPLVEVGVDVGELEAGQYSGLIRVEAPGANNSPQFVTVELTVLPPGSNPGVLVRPTGLIFATRACTSSPGSQRVRLATAAPGSVEAGGGVVTLDGGDWLQAVPRNLVVAAADPRNITLQPSLGSLVPDVYRAALTLVFADGSPAQPVNILFLVVGAAGAAGESEPHTSARGFDSETQQECAPQQLLAVHRTLGSNFASPVGFPTPILTQVVDDCGEAVRNATVVASFSSGDPALVLASLRNGIYSGTWVPATQAGLVIVTVRASLPPLADAMVQAQVTVQANPTVAVLFTGGVVNGASFTPGEALAPGSIVSVFGSNLASGLNFASQVPLETTLGGATINIGGVDAPLFFTSSGQVNAQIPFELAATSRPHVVVQTRRDGSGPESVTVPGTITLAEARPGIFSTNQQGSGQGAILDAQGRLVDSASPAGAGEIIQVFCTGLGATNPAVASGAPGPAAEPLARVVTAVEAQVGGRQATVHFAGLAPGFVGLYQVNVEIPAEVEPGPAVPLLLLQNGVPSNTVTIAVQ